MSKDDFHPLPSFQVRVVDGPPGLAALEQPNPLTLSVFRSPYHWLHVVIPRPELGGLYRRATVADFDVTDVERFVYHETGSILELDFQTSTRLALAMEALRNSGGDATLLMAQNEDYQASKKFLKLKCLADLRLSCFMLGLADVYVRVEDSDHDQASFPDHEDGDVKNSNTSTSTTIRQQHPKVKYFLVKQRPLQDVLNLGLPHAGKVFSEISRELLGDGAEDLNDAHKCQERGWWIIKQETGRSTGGATGAASAGGKQAGSSSPAEQEQNEDGFWSDYVLELGSLSAAPPGTPGGSDSQHQPLPQDLDIEDVCGLTSGSLVGQGGVQISWEQFSAMGLKNLSAPPGQNQTTTMRSSMAVLPVLMPGIKYPSGVAREICDRAFAQAAHFGGLAKAEAAERSGSGGSGGGAGSGGRSGLTWRDFLCPKTWVRSKHLGSLPWGNLSCDLLEREVRRELAAMESGAADHVDRCDIQWWVSAQLLELNLSGGRFVPANCVRAIESVSSSSSPHQDGVSTVASTGRSFENSDSSKNEEEPTADAEEEASQEVELHISLLRFPPELQNSGQELDTKLVTHALSLSHTLLRSGVVRAQSHYKLRNLFFLMPDAEFKEYFRHAKVLHDGNNNAYNYLADILWEAKRRGLFAREERNEGESSTERETDSTRNSIMSVGLESLRWYIPPFESAEKNLPLVRDKYLRDRVVDLDFANMEFGDLIGEIEQGFHRNPASEEDDRITSLEAACGLSTSNPFLSMRFCEALLELLESAAVLVDGMDGGAAAPANGGAAVVDGVERELLFQLLTKRCSFSAAGLPDQSVFQMLVLNLPSADLAGRFAENVLSKFTLQELDATIHPTEGAGAAFAASMNFANVLVSFTAASVAGPAAVTTQMKRGATGPTGPRTFLNPEFWPPPFCSVKQAQGAVQARANVLAVLDVLARQ